MDEQRTGGHEPVGDPREQQVVVSHVFEHFHGNDAVKLSCVWNSAMLAVIDLQVVQVPSLGLLSMKAFWLCELETAVILASGKLFGHPKAQ